MDETRLLSSLPAFTVQQMFLRGVGFQGLGFGVAGLRVYRGLGFKGFRGLGFTSDST